MSAQYGAHVFLSRTADFQDNIHKVTYSRLALYCLQVKVRRRGSDTKFIAKVLAQGPECDIGGPRFHVLKIKQGTDQKRGCLHS